MYLVSFLIGLIIVISSIFLIRREFNRAVRSQKMLLEQSRIYKGSDLFALLEGLQSSIDEMNRAFFDIAEDLEGKYSIHDKELQLLEESINQIKQSLTKIQIAKSNSNFEINHPMTQVPMGQEQLDSIRHRIDHMNTIATQLNENTSAIQTSDSAHKTRLMESRQIDEKQNDAESDMINRIIELRSQGKQLPQIAKELGIGMGELQLLIALKK